MHPLIRDVQKDQLKKVPEVKTGYTVCVSQKIKEGNKERIQNFEGLVIKVNHGEGTEKAFTVRKIVEGIGVEKIFPLHSPNITKILVKKKAKVRRSKLYYMRERFGKSARLSERHVTDEERAAEEAKMNALIEEAIKAEEKKKKEEAVSTPEVATEEIKEDVSAEATEEVVAQEEEKKEDTPEVESEPTAETEAVDEKKEEA